MAEQFDFKDPLGEARRKEEARQKEIMLDEILYEWPVETRIAQYRLLVGQKPKASMSERHIAESIIDPEKERLRIIAENREENNEDATRNHRR